MLKKGIILKEKMIHDQTRYKKQVNVNMSGKEYLEHIKYHDAREKKFGKVFRSYVYAFRYFISALIVYLLVQFLIYVMFPTVYVAREYGMLNIGIFVFPYLLLYLVIVAIAMAWVIHGFGFIIVKR